MPRLAKIVCCSHGDRCTAAEQPLISTDDKVSDERHNLSGKNDEWKWEPRPMDLMVCPHSVKDGEDPRVAAFAYLTSDITDYDLGFYTGTLPCFAFGSSGSPVCTEGNRSWRGIGGWDKKAKLVVADPSANSPASKTGERWWSSERAGDDVAQHCLVYRTASETERATGLASAEYIGIKTTTAAEKAVKKRSAFKIYHQIPHAPKLADLPASLDLFVVYKISSGSYRHLPIVTTSVQGNDMYSVAVEGEKEPRSFENVDKLIEHYQNELQLHCV